MYPNAPEIQLMASRFNNSSELAESSNPSNAFFVARTAINKMEITTGKLNTAINTLLLFAFEAIPEIKLSEVENPTDANSSTIKNVS